MQIDTKEINLSVKRYLAGLGFPEHALKTDVRTGLGQVDLVVFEDHKPLVVVEYKSAENLPTADDKSQLRFHPFVRQLQSYAAALKAPYYLLSNGKSFLWFTTDDTGRPDLLEKPVVPVERQTSLPQATRVIRRTEIVEVLRAVQDLLIRKSAYESTTKEAAILILAKLLSERGNDLVINALLDSAGRDGEQLLSSSIHVVGKAGLQKTVMQDALRVLDQIVLSSAPTKELLAACDEVFKSPQKGREFRIHRWLADFLVQLGQTANQHTLVDISSSHGDVLAATWLLPQARQPSSAWGISRSEIGAIWAKIQQVALGKDQESIFQGNPLLAGSTALRGLPTPTHVISAPSFGSKVEHAEFSLHLPLSGIYHEEDLLLELATKIVGPKGRIVMLVPEGLLFSSNRVNTRKLILEQTNVTAIISLPSGALLPYSNVKSTILVLDNKPKDIKHEVFLAVVDEVFVGDTFDSQEIPRLGGILEDFRRFTSGGTRNGNSWIVSAGELSVDNLTANYYATSGIANAEYQLVQLKELTNFRKKGSAIKLDEAGSIPVIGPGAIRPMTIDGARLDKTSVEQVPSNALLVQVGDVVVNNIGTHLGASAVVESNVAEHLFSRHVIVLRVNTAVITPEYLAAALNSAYVKGQIRQRATGSVIPALSLERFADVQIPVPDIARQNEIVAGINRARERQRRAQSELEQAELNLTNLFEKMFVSDSE